MVLILPEAAQSAANIIIADTGCMIEFYIQSPNIVTTGSRISKCRAVYSNRTIEMNSEEVVLHYLIGAFKN